MFSSPQRASEKHRGNVGMKNISTNSVVERDLNRPSTTRIDLRRGSVEGKRGARSSNGVAGAWSDPVRSIQVVEAQVLPKKSAESRRKGLATCEHR